MSISGDSSWRTFEGGHRQPRLQDTQDWTAWFSDEAQARCREDLKFWQEQFRDRPVPLEILADRPTTATGEHRLSRRVWEAKGEVVDLLRRRSQEWGVEPESWLLAAWTLLIHHLTGRRRFSLGWLPEDGAETFQQQLEVVPLLCELDLRSSGESWMARLTHQLHRVQLHRRLPSDQLLEAIDPPNSRVGDLFRVAMSNGADPLGALERGGVTRRDEAGLLVSDQTLILVVQAWPPESQLESSRLHFGFLYPWSSFDSTTIERLGQMYAQTLCELLETPRRPLLQDGLLASQRQQLLYEWSGGEGVVQSVPVADQIAVQIRDVGDRVALINADIQISYGGLESRIEHLAERLHEHGIQPLDRVGLTLEKSPNVFIAMLAIWRVEAIGLPLEPSRYPPGQLTEMLNDAGQKREAVLLLADEESVARLPPGSPWLRVDVEGPVFAGPTVDGDTATGEAVDREPKTRPMRKPDLTSLACLFYSPEALETPRGAMMQQGAFAHGVAWLSQTFGPEMSEGMLLSKDVGIDFALYDGFSALCSGGTIIFDRSAISKVGARPRLLSATASEWAGEISRNPISDSLRAVCTLGEALNSSLIQRQIAQKELRIIQRYSPSSSAALSLVRMPVREPSQANAAAVIGRPTGGSRVRVLDQRGRPVPIGVPGELALSGPALALGTWRQPRLTAKLWVPDPFATQPGQRLFLTGDRVRFQADGELVALGRWDDQVRVRGMRMKTDEIEACLRGHAEIEAVAVLAAPLEAIGGPGDRLIAYLVPRGSEVPSGLELRALLARRFTEAMMPSVFIALESLPRHPSGALDRAALPRPQDLAEIDVCEYVAPRDDLEAMLVQIWAEHVATERISIYDNFFALGGDSLAMIRMLNQAARCLQLDPSPALLLSATTIALLAQRLRRLLQEELRQQEELQQEALGREQGELVSEAAAQIFDASQTQRPAALPPQQERFLREGRGIEPLVLVFDSRATLNDATLARAWRDLQNRYRWLCTELVKQAGELVPRIASPSALLTRCDLTHLDNADREVVSEFWCRQVAGSLDLEAGSTSRLIVMDHGDAATRLLFIVHPMVCDLRSSMAIVHELGLVYDRRSSGLVSTDLRSPLGGEIAPSRWRREGSDKKPARCWWQRELEGYAEDLDECPPDPWAGPRRISHAFTLPASLVKRLRHRAQESGVSLATASLGVFVALLHRYRGEREFLVGCCVCGASETLDLPGPWARFLPLRFGFDHQPNFGQTLTMTRHRVLAALAHREGAEGFDLPGLGRPGCPQGFVYWDFSSSSAKSGFVLRRPLPQPTSGALVLHVAQAAPWLDDRQALALWFDGDPALHDQAMLIRLAGHWQRLCRSLVEEPHRPLDRLSMLSEAEEHQLRFAWNDTAFVAMEDGLLERIEARIDRVPERIAVVSGDRQLSYLQLDQEANRLARHLCERRRDLQPTAKGYCALDRLASSFARWVRLRGHGAGSGVAICLRRDIEMLIAVLAVLKAEGWFVPMAPTLPSDRLQWLLEDSRVGLLLTDDAGLSELAPAFPIERRSIENPRILCHSRQRLATQRCPESLTCVLYRSAKAGTPAGVEVHDGAVLSRLSALRERPGIDEDDTLLATHSVASDASFLELYLPIFRGSRLVFSPQGNFDRGPAMRRFISRYRITLLQAGAEVWQWLLEDPFAGRSSLKALCGRETLSPDLRHRLLARTRGVWQLYGPSQATSWVTAGQVGERGPADLGRPLLGIRLYVVDRRARLLPPGVAGELWVGGRSLAAGYLGRTAATAEAFVPDGFGGEPGERVFCTGDCARWLPDGRLEGLGRLRYQVRIRGQRVDLAEIEACLCEHPDVEDGAVGAHSERGGRFHLTAYFVPSDRRRLGATELRAFMAEHLPSHLIPETYVELMTLPRTSEYKIDRCSLPSSGRQTPQSVPRTGLEKAVALLWRHWLGVDQISLQDHFFHLGGQSLQAKGLSGQLSTCMECALPVGMIFEAPVLTELVTWLERALLDQLERRHRSWPCPPPQRLELVRRRDRLSPQQRQERAERIERAFQRARALVSGEESESAFS